MKHGHAPIRTPSGEFCVEHDHTFDVIDHGHTWIGESPRAINTTLVVPLAAETDRSVASLEPVLAAAGPL